MRWPERISSRKLICAGSILAVASLAYAQSGGDAALNAVRSSDRADLAQKSKQINQLPAAEHARRAGIYMLNREFAEARAHWQALIDNYPDDVNVPAALYGIARSYYIERRYEEARQTYERVARDYSQTKEGREGLNFSASSLLRMGRGAEAAARYQEYLEKYPNGERIDTAHLNIIDGYRESGRPDDAIAWIDRTRGRFAGTATDANAQFARLRLDIAVGDWQHAVQTADDLLGKPFPKGTNTNADEVLYLKAHSLERAGRSEDSIQSYLLIPDTATSYYGPLATSKLAKSGDRSAQQRAAERAQSSQSAINAAAVNYPAPY